MSLPVGVAPSRFNGEDAERGFPLCDPSDDPAKIDGRARNAIDLGDDEHIPLADEGQRLFEGRAGSD
jgi:hypothetical protein